ncbi:hypothetical protein SKAU_G00084570 [Synaphobranchus kaupii]|uniref:Uncharacterized protein n=1 Tax=Synaphobranchus kaupii TaxID=118154 RepID=A0A9Q1FVZ8_SYNKA|nr:hypothetical protein SKAU_G00084570 [Synaphobranchus kaupii]
MVGGRLRFEYSGALSERRFSRYLFPGACWDVASRAIDLLAARENKLKPGVRLAAFQQPRTAGGSEEAGVWILHPHKREAAVCPVPYGSCHPSAAGPAGLSTSAAGDGTLTVLQCQPAAAENRSPARGKRAPRSAPRFCLPRSAAVSVSKLLSSPSSSPRDPAAGRKRPVPRSALSFSLSFSPPAAPFHPQVRGSAGSASPASPRPTRTRRSLRGKIGFPDFISSPRIDGPALYRTARPAASCPPLVMDVGTAGRSSAPRAAAAFPLRATHLGAAPCRDFHGPAGLRWRDDRAEEVTCASGAAAASGLVNCAPGADGLWARLTIDGLRNSSHLSIRGGRWRRWCWGGWHRGKESWRSADATHRLNGKLSGGRGVGVVWVAQRPAANASAASLGKRRRAANRLADFQLARLSRAITVVGSARRSSPAAHLRTDWRQVVSRAGTCSVREVLISQPSEQSVLEEPGHVGVFQTPAAGIMSDLILTDTHQVDTLMPALQPMETGF